MDLILGIIYLLFLGYFALLLFYLWNWEKMPAISANAEKRMPTVSVIIPVRNEASGIAKGIDSILSQDYEGDFDIIIIDDHSTDGTPDIVRRNYASISHVQLIHMSVLPNREEGKKAALALGIEQARGKIIVTTDGDCMYSTAWLSSLVDCFDQNVQIVTGPVIYPIGKKMLEGFQSLDLLSLILATAAGIQSRSYFLGNGANMAFSKQAFNEVNGYVGNEDYASGDDLFLIQKIVDHYGVESIAYAKSHDAAVLTNPPEAMRAFLMQRMRWASKNTALNGRRIYYLWIFLWCVNVATLALLIFGIFGYTHLLTVAILIYIKMMIEGIALYRVAKHFNMTSVMRWFPWAFFINILYVISIGIMANLSPSFEWKGRLQR